MKKIYESPKAEVISFTAMEQLASQDELNGTINLISKANI
jgi:hypothetical protein